MLLSFLLSTAALTQVTLAQPAARPAPIFAWAAKPLSAPYRSPNRPVQRLSDLVAAHAGQKSWSQTIVRDPAGLTGRYIQMAPGEKTKTIFYADSSMFWIVAAGQMRVVIEGQEPFTASKGFIVQVPATTCNYSLIPASQSLPASSGSSSTWMRASAGCTWTATSVARASALSVWSEAITASDVPR